MKKFDITTLSKLNPGDRFYFPRNRNLLCTYLGTFNMINTYSYKNDNGTIIDETKDKRVIFLRNIDD